MKRPCKGCNAPTQGARCPDCAPIAERQRQARQPYRAGYGSPEHRAFIQAVRTRAQDRCERCGVPEVLSRHEVDHIIPLSTARTAQETRALNDPSNGWLLCRACHAAKRRTA